MTLVRVGAKLVIDLDNVVEIEDLTVEEPEVRVTYCEGSLQSVTHRGPSAQALRDIISLVPDVSSVLGLRSPNSNGGHPVSVHGEPGIPDRGDDPPVRNQGG